MAYEERLQNFTYEANADLSGAGNIYRFVKEIAGSGTRTVRVNRCDTLGERALGVLQNKPKAQGHAATVGRAGVSKVEAGGVIARGDDITTDATGRAVVAAAGHAVLGVAQLAAAAAGTIISVDLLLLGRPDAA